MSGLTRLFTLNGKLERSSSQKVGSTMREDRKSKVRNYPDFSVREVCLSNCKTHMLTLNRK